MRDKITCPTCGGHLINENVESSEDLWICDCGHVLQDGVHTPPVQEDETKPSEHTWRPQGLVFGGEGGDV